MKKQAFIKGMGMLAILGLLVVGSWGSMALAGANPHVAEAIAHAEEIINTEINSVTDNPNVFEEDDNLPVRRLLVEGPSGMWKKIYPELIWPDCDCDE